MNLTRSVILVLTPAFLFGCGNWDAVYRKHNFTDGDSAITDIKSRAIISAVEEYTLPNESGTSNKRVRICAEPSPDAITAYAAELAAKVQKGDDTSLGINGAYQGSAGFTGQRTQTVQLLRDQLYRLCEANLNGWLNPREYEMLLSRNQRYTLALMTIENLTDVIRPPAVILETSGSASSPQNIDNIKKKITELQLAKAELEKKDPKTAEDTKKIESTTQEITKLNSELEKAERTIATGTATGKFLEDQAQQKNKDAHVAAISEIALALINQPDTLYKCFNYLQETAKFSYHDKETAQIRQKFESYCLEILKTEGEKLKAIQATSKQQVREIENQ